MSEVELQWYLSPEGERSQFRSDARLRADAIVTKFYGPYWDDEPMLLSLWAEIKRVIEEAAREAVAQAKIGE